MLLLSVLLLPFLRLVGLAESSIVVVGRAWLGMRACPVMWGDGGRAREVLFCGDDEERQCCVGWLDRVKEVKKLATHDKQSTLLVVPVGMVVVATRAASPSKAMM